MYDHEAYYDSMPRFCVEYECTADGKDFIVNFEEKSAPRELPDFMSELFAYADVRTNSNGGLPVCQESLDKLYIAMFTLLRAMAEDGVLYRPPLATRFSIDME